MVPITNDQLGVWRENEPLEAFWVVERDPSSPTLQPASPVAGNITQDEDIDVGDLSAQTTIVTPEGSRFSVVEAPPPQVKKMESHKHY